MPVTRLEYAAMAIILGALFGWLTLLETGLAHRRDVGAGVLWVIILVTSVGAAWWWLKNWERLQ